LLLDERVEKNLPQPKRLLSSIQTENVILKCGLSDNTSKQTLFSQFIQKKRTVQAKELQLLNTNNTQKKLSKEFEK